MEGIIRRVVRRHVQPFTADVEVDVNLYDVIRRFGDCLPDPEWIEPIYDWIEARQVSLEVIALQAMLPPSKLARVHELSLRASGTSETHRRLCALALLYLESQGFSCNMGGASTCAYAGGWADVAANNGSIFAECGTLNDRKLLDAMEHGQPLLIVPYGLGCVVGEDPNDRLATKRRLTAENAGREPVWLGYLFWPIEVPRDRLLAERKKTFDAVRRVWSGDEKERPPPIPQAPNAEKRAVKSVPPRVPAAAPVPEDGDSRMLTIEEIEARLQALGVSVKREGSA